MFSVARTRFDVSVDAVKYVIWALFLNGTRGLFNPPLRASLAKFHRVWFKSPIRKTTFYKFRFLRMGQNHPDVIKMGFRKAGFYKYRDNTAKTWGPHC